MKLSREANWLESLVVIITTTTTAAAGGDVVRGGGGLDDTEVWFEQSYQPKFQRVSYYFKSKSSTLELTGIARNCVIHNTAERKAFLTYHIRFVKWTATDSHQRTIIYITFSLLEFASKVFDSRPLTENQKLLW